MKEITLLIWTYFFYVSIKELIWLYRDLLRGKYIEWVKHHNIQHMIMIVMLALIWVAILWVCENEYLTPLLLYELTVIFYILPHLTLERLWNDFY